MGLQLAEGAGDLHLALGEAGRERLDADLGPGRQRLDVDADPDRDEGQLGVLGEVIADDREPARVRDHGVKDAGGRDGPGNCGQGMGQGDIVLGIHREAVSSLVVRSSLGIAVPAGAVSCLGVGSA
ncbi:hypothetical protein AMK23_27505 [Streptomyces sp. CB02130]|nr:hypothetical protein AMK23_27505 [Streptomyces sp. CB02130]